MYSFAPIAFGLELAATATTTLTAWLAPLAGTWAPVLAIVVLTAAVRLLLLPLSHAQVRGERDRNRLSPKLREVQRRHGQDPQRLRAEAQRLSSETGLSPLAMYGGCLPGLAQAPVFLTLYGLFITPEIGGAPNTLLDAPMAGVSLGSGLLGSGLGPHLGVFAALLAILTLLAWAYRRLVLLPSQTAAGADQAAGTARIAAFIPFASVVIATFVPLAAGIYLATTMALSLGERLALRRIVGT